MAQLYAANIHELRGTWGGVRGEQIWGLLHCKDLPYFEHEIGKTIGHGAVLPPAKRNHTDALATLHRLLQKAAMRLRHAQLYAGALRASVDYTDDTTWSDELRLTETQDTLRLTHALNDLCRTAGDVFPSHPAAHRCAPDRPHRPEAAHPRPVR